jgi:hypothetical protein
MKQPFSFRPLFSEMVDRDHVSRFSDCGHTESGDFDHGNTCGSLRHGKETNNDKPGSSKEESSKDIHEHIDKFKKLSLKEFEQEINKLKDGDMKNTIKKRIIDYHKNIIYNARNYGTIKSNDPRVKIAQSFLESNK